MSYRIEPAANTIIAPENTIPKENPKAILARITPSATNPPIVRIDPKKESLLRKKYPKNE